MSTGSSKKKYLTEKEAIFYKEVGQRITVFRKARGLNQQQMADRVGVGKITIAKIEIGAQRAMFFLYENIAQVLEVEISDISANVRAVMQGKAVSAPIDPKLLGRLVQARDS